MDALFCIVLSIIVLRWWWKGGAGPINDGRNTVGNRFSKRKNRRKLTTDEVITVVLPTIRHDGK